jgi:hypothetical protein
LLFAQVFSILIAFWELSFACTCASGPQYTLLGCDSSKGSYAVKTCNFIITKPDSCVIDTIYRINLLDTLKSKFERNQNVFIGYIDSVIYYKPDLTDSAHSFRQYRESLHVHIEIPIKGTQASDDFWCVIPAGDGRSDCWASSDKIIREEFVGFFNDFSTSPYLGISQNSACSEESGFFIQNGRISQKGWQKLPFVSVSVQEFIDYVKPTWTCKERMQIASLKLCGQFIAIKRPYLIIGNKIDHRLLVHQGSLFLILQHNGRLNRSFAACSAESDSQ